MRSTHACHNPSLTELNLFLSLAGPSVSCYSNRLQYKWTSLAAQTLPDYQLTLCCKRVSLLGYPFVKISFMNQRLCSLSPVYTTVGHANSSSPLSSPSSIEHWWPLIIPGYSPNSFLCSTSFSNLHCYSAACSPSVSSFSLTNPDVAVSTSPCDWITLDFQVSIQTLRFPLTSLKRLCSDYWKMLPGLLFLSSFL